MMEEIDRFQVPTVHSEMQPLVRDSGLLPLPPPTHTTGGRRAGTPERMGEGDVHIAEVQEEDKWGSREYTEGTGSIQGV